MTEGVTYVLEHRSGSSRNWFFSRWLPPNEKDARLELLRMRALAEGAGTNVEYRVKRRTVEDLSW